MLSMLWHNLYKLGYFNARKIVAQIPKSESEMSTSAPLYLQHDTTACVCIYHTNLMSICQEKKNVTNSFFSPSLSSPLFFMHDS